MKTYPWNTRWYRFKHKCNVSLSEVWFVSTFMIVWLMHVLIFGWFQYCFKPRMYVIKAKYILEDVARPHNKGSHDFWWSKYHCEAAKKAAAMNDPESYVRFVERIHPWFLDNDIFYVKSNGYKARWIQDREKLYPLAK